jgi:hypothetical protein
MLISQFPKNNSQMLKKHYNSPFWQLVRDHANAKIKAALRPDNTLIWDKLPNILSTNPKVEKSPDTDEKFLVNIIHLAPSWASLFNTCSRATIGCGTNCLNESGHGQRHMINNGSHTVHVARVIRSIIWFKYRDQFKAKAQREIDSLKRKAFKLGATPVLRPNGTSDLKFESLWPQLFNDNHDLVIYDYTKDSNRDVSHLSNYYLCYSVSEDSTQQQIEQAFSNGLNCIVVFRINKTQPKPIHYNGRPVIDCDKHDLRFLDPIGVYGGLSCKGNTAIKDSTGFVKDVPQYA